MLVLERRRNLLLGLVVASKTMDTRLDEDQAVLSVLVLSVNFKMLADGNSLLYEMVEILRNIGSEALGLQDSKDLVAGDESDLWNTM